MSRVRRAMEAESPQGCSPLHPISAMPAQHCPARHSIRRLGVSLEILNQPLGAESLFETFLSAAFRAFLVRREMLNTLGFHFLGNSFPLRFLIALNLVRAAPFSPGTLFLPREWSLLLPIHSPLTAAPPESITTTSDIVTSSLIGTIY